jgi:hypothetical protein
MCAPPPLPCRRRAAVRDQHAGAARAARAARQLRGRRLCRIPRARVPNAAERRILPLLPPLTRRACAFLAAGAPSWGCCCRPPSCSASAGRVSSTSLGMHESAGAGRILCVVPLSHCAPPPAAARWACPCCSSGRRWCRSARPPQPAPPPRQAQRPRRCSALAPFGPSSSPTWCAQRRTQLKPSQLHPNLRLMPPYAALSNHLGEPLQLFHLSVHDANLLCQGLAAGHPRLRALLAAALGGHGARRCAAACACRVMHACMPAAEVVAGRLCAAQGGMSYFAGAIADALQPRLGTLKARRQLRLRPCGWP